MNMVYDPTRKFVDPDRVLFAAGLSASQVFADLGAGSGFYSLSASKIVGDSGMVYSVDILESALDHVAAEARLKNVHNIKTIRCDLEQTESCKQIPVGSVDMVLLTNITHQITQKANLFTEAYRILKTGGKLVVIDWNEQPSPIGPQATDRITASDVTSLARKATFKSGGNMEIDAYHFGLIFIK